MPFDSSFQFNALPCAEGEPEHLRHVLRIQPRRFRFRAGRLLLLARDQRQAVLTMPKSYRRKKKLFFALTLSMLIDLSILSQLLNTRFMPYHM